MMQHNRRDQWNAALAAAEGSGVPHKQVTAAFSGVEMPIANEPFSGAELIAAFGGMEIDLRQAIIERDAVIRAVAVFGGVDIRVPENVRVQIYPCSLFGGVECKRVGAVPDGAPTLHIKATAVFGGVDIE